MWLDEGDSRIADLMKLVDGRQFYGIVAVNTVLRTQNDIADYLLQLNKYAPFPVEGDACYHDGRKFILGRGVTEFVQGPLFRSLRMITVDQELAWSRSAPVHDRLSGLATDTVPTALGTALCCVEATSKISDIFRVNTSKFALITNSAIQVNDRLGPYIVTFVETRHGIQYAEVR